MVVPFRYVTYGRQKQHLEVRERIFGSSQIGRGGGGGRILPRGLSSAGWRTGDGR